MKSLIIKNNFVKYSDLKFIKSNLSFDISDDNLEEIILCLTVNFNNFNGDYENFFNILKEKMNKHKYNRIDVEVDVSDEVKDIVEDLIDSVKTDLNT